MNQFLDAAIEAAKMAGSIQLEYLDREHDVKLKSVANLVTEVDVKCEKAIIDLLSQRFPDHSFLAEEGGESRPGSDHLWIIDPLDGTTNYAHRYARFCVSIALAIRGQVAVGVVNNARGGELFTATRGGGAFLNGKPIRVSTTAKVEDSLVCTGFSYDRGKRLGRDLGVYTRMLPEAQSMRRDGCAALDLCDVACGRFDAFWEFNLNAWDIAAGCLAIEEAGGKWSGVAGQVVDLHAKQFLCTNGLIHEEMIKIMAVTEEEMAIK